MRGYVLGTALVAALLVAACSGSDDQSSLEVVVELRADGSAPVGFGVRPGDLLVGVEVELELSGSAHPVTESLTRTTDDNGRLTVMATRTGLLEVSVRAAPSDLDPLCGWIESGKVTVSDGPATLILDELWVAFE